MLRSVAGAVLLCWVFVGVSVVQGFDIDTKAFLQATPIHPIINPDATASQIAEVGDNNTARSVPECKRFLKLRHGDAGVITSPNYPRPYPSNADCVWFLEAPESSRISITFFDIHIQPWLFSFFDYIHVSRTGNFDDTEQFLGDLNRQTPFTMLSVNNKFGVRFRSSAYLNYRGFKLIYTVQTAEKDAENTIDSKDAICGLSAYTEQYGQEQPDIDFISTTTPAADRRDHYGKLPKLRGEIYPKVVGGEVSLPHAYPWMAALLIDRSSFCGGSLIDNRHVLTAAHCTDGAKTITILLGSHNLKLNRTKEPSRVLFNITQADVFQHPSFNARTVTHDIAIIRLPRRVKFTDKVRPVCLPNKHQIAETFENRTVRVTGWGKTEDAKGAVSAQLKHVEIRVSPNGVCKQRFRGVFTGNLICGKPSPKLSPCKGDSGGPLHVMQKYKSGEERLLQIGLVSFGTSSCEIGEPVGFTRLTAFLDFIEKVTTTNVVKE